MRLFIQLSKGKDQSADSKIHEPKIGDATP